MWVVVLGLVKARVWGERRFRNLGGWAPSPPLPQNRKATNQALASDLFALVPPPPPLSLATSRFGSPVPTFCVFGTGRVAVAVTIKFKIKLHVD